MIMNNAIILFVYQKPDQVNMFIEQLLSGTTMDIYIHINKKFDQIRKQLIKNSRIYITDKNLPANWVDDGLCKAIALMLKEVISTGKRYNHILLASGQDMLVRRGIDEYLQDHSRKIFFGIHGTSQSFSRLLHFKQIPRFFMNKFDSKYHPIRMARAAYFKLLSSSLGGYI